MFASWNSPIAGCCSASNGTVGNDGGWQFQRQLADSHDETHEASRALAQTGRGATQWPTRDAAAGEASTLRSPTGAALDLTANPLSWVRGFQPSPSAEIGLRQREADQSHFDSDSAISSPDSCNQRIDVLSEADERQSSAGVTTCLCERPHDPGTDGGAPLHADANQTQPDGIDFIGRLIAELATFRFDSLSENDYE